MVARAEHQQRERLGLPDSDRRSSSSYATGAAAETSRCPEGDFSEVRASNWLVACKQQQECAVWGICFVFNMQYNTVMEFGFCG
jgi:hypothetical protein